MSIENNGKEAVKAGVIELKEYEADGGSDD